MADLTNGPVNGIEWRPRRREAEGLVIRSKIDGCEHRWGNRKTSPYRRMYCGDCDVDFEPWRVVNETPDVPVNTERPGPYRDTVVMAVSELRHLRGELERVRGEGQGSAPTVKLSPEVEAALASEGLSFVPAERPDRMRPLPKLEVGRDYRPTNDQEVVKHRPVDGPVDERDLGERCAHCRRRYLTVWLAIPDDLWALVATPMAGLMCPGCFDERARMMGIQLYWTAAAWGWGFRPAPEQPMPVPNLITGSIRELALEEAARAVEDGSFLTRESPEFKFGQSAAAMLRRRKGLTTDHIIERIRSERVKSQAPRSTLGEFEG